MATRKKRDEEAEEQAVEERQFKMADALENIAIRMMSKGAEKLKPADLKTIGDTIKQAASIRNEARRTRRIREQNKGQKT